MPQTEICQAAEKYEEKIVIKVFKIIKFSTTYFSVESIFSKQVVCDIFIDINYSSQKTAKICGGKCFWRKKMIVKLHPSCLTDSKSASEDNRVLYHLYIAKLCKHLNQ